MEFIEAIILGAIQGLTEFIPVSSTGHLAIAQALMGLEEQGFHLFLEFVNFGTLLALIIYFWRKIVEILKGIVVDHNWRLARNIIITCLPAGVIGFLLASWIENTSFFGALITVAVSVGVIGLLMLVVNWLPKLSEVSGGEKLSGWRALWIGLAQVLALIPGVSRSGSTILAGRVAGMNSRAAAEYSFLVSIPLLCGVILKTMISSSDREYMLANFDTLAVSNLFAFIFGLFAVGFLMRFLKREHSLQIFGAYRVVLSAVLLVFCFSL